MSRPSFLSSIQNSAPPFSNSSCLTFLCMFSLDINEIRTFSRFLLSLSPISYPIFMIYFISLSNLPTTGLLSVFFLANSLYSVIVSLFLCPLTWGKQSFSWYLKILKSAIKAIESAIQIVKRFNEIMRAILRWITVAVE